MHLPASFVVLFDDLDFGVESQECADPGCLHEAFEILEDFPSGYMLAFLDTELLPV